MTTLYKKVGRRYKPAAEHEEWDSYPAGAHLVVCSPGSTRAWARLRTPWLIWL